MEKSKKHVQNKQKQLQETINLISPNCNSSFISENLLLFQKQIFYDNFSSFSKQDLHNVLVKIWTCLLYHLNNENSSIRISVSRSIGAFLRILAPFLSDEISISLTQVLSSNKYTSKAKPYIAAAYVYLLKYVSLPFLTQFNHFVHFYEYFAFSDDMQSLDLIPNIIQSIPNPSVEWISDLMNRFILLNNEKSNRNIHRSIAAIIEHYPDYFYPLFFSKTAQNEEMIEKNIQLYAYIFNTVPLPQSIPTLKDKEKDKELLSSKLESSSFSSSDELSAISKKQAKQISVDIDDIFEKIALICLKHIEKHENIASVDNSLNLLSCLNPKYLIVDVDIDETNQTVAFKYKNLYKCENVPLNMLKKVINFYKINTLPYQTFLKPTENDGALLLAAKFTSVSHLIENHELNVDQIISILNTIVTTKYSDRISQYFKLLKKTINVLLNIDNSELNSVIRRILLNETNVTTWNNCLDITLIFEEINPKLAISKLGNNFIIDEILQLFNFLSFPNQTLESKVLETLSVLSSSLLENMENKAYEKEKIEQFLLTKIDLFDTTNLIPFIKGLDKLNIASKCIFDCLCELILSHDQNIDLIQCSFNYLSKKEFSTYFKDNNNLKQNIKNLITEVLKQSYLVLTHSQIFESKTKQDDLDESPETNKQKKLMKPSFGKNSKLMKQKEQNPNDLMEITTKTTNYLNQQMEAKFELNSQEILQTNTNDNPFYSIIDSSINLISYISLTEKEDSSFLKDILNAYEDLFEISPYYTSLFLLTYWKEIDESQRNAIFAKGNDLLKNVSDTKINEIWCQICLEDEAISNATETSLTVGFLHVICSQVLQLPTKLSMTSLVLYSILLWKTLPNSRAIVIDFYLTLTKRQKHDFSLEMRKQSLIVLNDFQKQLKPKDIVELEDSSKIADENKVQMNDTKDLFNIDFFQQLNNEEVVLEKINSLLQNGTRTQILNFLYFLSKTKDFVISQKSLSNLFIQKQFFDLFLDHLTNTELTVESSLDTVLYKVPSQSSAASTQLASKEMRTIKLSYLSTLDEDEILNYVFSPETKFTKRLILSFSSIVSELNMSKSKIFRNIFNYFVNSTKDTKKLEAKKAKRLTYVTRLFATICKDCGTFDQKSHNINILDFVCEFLNQNLEILNLDESSLLLEQLIFKLIPQKHHIFLVYKMFNQSSLYSMSYSKFAAILLQRKDLLKQIGNKNVTIKLNTCIQDVFNSFVSRPTTQYYTCRMLMAVPELNPQNIVVKSILEDLMQMIIDEKSSGNNNYISTEVIDCISNTSQIITTNLIWRNSVLLLTVKENEANFVSISKFYPLIFLSCPSTNPLFNQLKDKVVEIFENNSTTPYIFIAGIEAVDAYSKRISIEIQSLDPTKKKYNKKVEALNNEKHDFIMKCVRAFGKCLRQNDSYYTFQCVEILCERICIYESYEQSLKYLLTILFSACRFSVLFPSVCAVSKKFPNIQDAINIINRVVIDFTKKDLLVKYIQQNDKETADTAIHYNYT